MAPNIDSSSTLVQNYPKNNMVTQKPSKLSMETLRRTISDISFELITQETLTSGATAKITNLPPIYEVEDAKCECCGMCEECTPQYVKKICDKYGQMICGLCSEAVKMEMEKNGGEQDTALQVHVSACSRFNSVGRAFPVLCQAEAMREVLRNSRGKSISPRNIGGIGRSSSCIPAITKEISTQNVVK